MKKTLLPVCALLLAGLAGATLSQGAGTCKGQHKLIDVQYSDNSCQGWSSRTCVNGQNTSSEGNAKRTTGQKIKFLTGTNCRGCSDECTNIPTGQREGSGALTGCTEADVDQFECYTRADY